MGSIWYPGRGTGSEWAELDVSDPGYGYLHVRRLDDRFAHLQEPHTGDPGEYAGVRMGALLDAVTTLALGSGESYVRVRPTRGQPLVIADDEAVGLLPFLQRAVALAIGGTDRFERVWPDDDAPVEPLCVHCNQGSPYHQAVTISAWCNEYGHHPFGTTQTWPPTNRP